MTVTKSDSRGYWETTPCQVVLMADREVYTIFYEGDYDTLEAEAAKCIVGTQEVILDYNNAGYYQSAMIIIGSNLARKRGGLGILQVQFAALYNREMWNIDFAEVSKDIKTWLVRDYFNSDNVPVAIWDEYRKLALWENNKTNETWNDWSNFQYPSVGDTPGGTLSGDTLKIAKKIMNGVSSYSIYVPVISRTTVHVISPTIGTIGKKQKPSDMPGWTGFNNQTLNTAWLGLAREWLKTAEKSSTNMDGTFTMVEQWQGCDLVDPDLYKEA